jgi:hypothetical protein
METALHSEIVPAVREALQRSDKPLSLTQLCKQLTGPFRVPEKKKSELRAVLQRDSPQGIYEWPKFRGSIRFWDRDPKGVAEAALIEIASEKPITRSVLLKALAKKVTGYKSETLIPELLHDRRLFEDPPWGRNRKLTAIRPDPERYRSELEGQLRPILEKYAALGITPLATSGTGAPTRVSAESIAEALERIEPRKGLVVALSRIRKAPELDGVSKSDFDRAVMQLLEQRRVFLHDHSAPHTLSAAEQEQLVTDGKGNFYVGIAWREPEHNAGLDS